MDLSAILQALTQADASAKASSPFAGIGNTASQIGDIVVQKSPQFGAGESAIAALLSGLVSGGAQGLTDSYVAKQNDLASDVLNKAMTGEVLRPEGMSPSVFSGIRNVGSTFKLQKEIEKEAASQEIENSVAKALKLAPITVATEVAAAKGKSALDGLGGIPASLQDDLLRQQQQAEKNQKVLEMVNNQFDEAKRIVSDPGRKLKSLNPWSADGKAINGIQQALINNLQVALGPEINQGTREALIPSLPTGSDFDANVIEQKKQRFLQQVQMALPTTPLVNRVQSQQLASASQAPASSAQKPGYFSDLRGEIGTGANQPASNIPAGAVPTGRTAGGKPTYLVDGKLWVPD